MKKLLNEIFLIVLPLCYIAYIIYIRLLIVRTPRILYVKMSYTSIILTIIIIFFLCLRIYSLLKKEGIIKEKTIKNKLLLKITENLGGVVAIFSNIWRNFYIYIVTKVLKVNLLIVSFAKFLDKHINPKSAFVILLLFEVLPKLILVTTFLFDIFIGQQFFYFYKVLFLLLLPLIYAVLRTVLLVFYHDNFDVLQSHVEEATIIDDITGEHLEVYQFTGDFDLPDYVTNIDDFLENHYFPVKNIINVIARFEMIKITYKINWVFIAFLLLHLLGWFTILFFGIYL